MLDQFPFHIFPKETRCREKKELVSKFLLSLKIDLVVGSLEMIGANLTKKICQNEFLLSIFTPTVNSKFTLKLLQQFQQRFSFGFIPSFSRVSESQVALSPANLKEKHKNAQLIRGDDVDHLTSLHEA